MKFEVQNIGFGLIAAENDNIILLGGMRSGSSSAHVTRRKYDIHDKNLWAKLIDEGMDKGEAQDKSKAGFVELFVKDGEELRFGVTGLVNIEINEDKRKSGLARKVLDGVRHTTGKELEIFDIKKHYASTWRKLGVEVFHNTQGGPVKVSQYKGTINGTMPPIEQAKNLEQKQSEQEFGM